jgi:hypothetical protein
VHARAERLVRPQIRIELDPITGDRRQPGAEGLERIDLLPRQFARNIVANRAQARVEPRREVAGLADRFRKQRELIRRLARERFEACEEPRHRIFEGVA